MNARLLVVALVLTIGCVYSGVGAIVPGPVFGLATGTGHSGFCGAIDAADSTIYDTTQVTQRPILFAATEELRYPRSARKRGAQGRVLLAVTVNADGSPDAKSIETISSPDSDLTRAATDWLRKASFMPVCRGGKAVRVRVAVPVDFKPDA